MAYLHVIWTEGPAGNIEHLAEHDVTPEEAEDVLGRPTARAASRRTGRSIAFGFTRKGRFLAVVYEQVDEITVCPVTSFDVEE